MRPPARVSDPVSVGGWPAAVIWTGSGSGTPLTTTAPPGPVTTTPGTIRMSPIAIASAPALRSSLSSCSTASPGIGPLTVTRTPSPRTPIEPDQARIRLRSLRIWPADVSPRSTAPARVSRWRSSAAISWRSWSLRVVRLATSTVRSCDDSAARPVVGRLRPELDDDEEAEQEQHGRDREAAATGGASGRAHGALGGGRHVRAAVAEGDRAGERRQVDRRRGRRTSRRSRSVSARCRTKSTKPGDRRTRSYIDAGPIAETWYGGARYAELTRTEPPMSTIAVATVTRSPLTAIASAPASHSSSTTVRMSWPDTR